MPTPDASISSVNGRLKFGKVNTGAVDRACFRESKTYCISEVQWRGSLVVALTRGAAMVAYF